MLRVILEASQDDLSDIIGEPYFNEIKTMQVMSFLRVTPEETVVIAKIELKNPKIQLKELFQGTKSI